MKKILFSLLVICQLGYSQNFKEKVEVVKNYPTSFDSTKKLADCIMEDYTHDKDKIEALYLWIINNVQYSIDESGRYSYSYQSKNEEIIKEKEYRNNLAKRVVSKRVAVCEGYSLLFSEVCDLMGIKCKLITGFGKSDVGMIGKFSSNHVWNLVEINNIKYFVDTTWGINSISNKEYDGYFMTEPSFFINGHYPDNFSYAFLDSILDKKTFSQLPIVYEKMYSIFNIDEPKNGTLKIGDINTKGYVFKFKWEDKVNSIDYYVDNKFYSVTEYSYENEELSFVVKSKLTRGKELLVYINNKPFLGYKLAK